MVGKRQLLIGSGKHRILLSTSDTRLARFLLENRFPRAHIPDYSVEEVSGYKGKNHQLVDHYSKGSEFKIAENNHEIFCRNPDPGDFAYVLLALFEKARHEKGEYSLHASAMTKKGNTILFFGDSGAGKSTMCKELTQRGWDFVSDERTVLKGTKIIGGTTASVPRKGEPIEQLGKRNLNITKIIAPRVTETSPRLLTDTWNSDRSDLKLYTEATRLLRANGIRLGHIVMDSLDKQELAQKRSRWSKQVISKLPITFVEGTPSKIADYIEGK